MTKEERLGVTEEKGLGRTSQKSPYEVVVSLAKQSPRKTQVTSKEGGTP
jgi:hypothetical protein